MKIWGGPQGCTCLACARPWVQVITPLENKIKLLLKERENRNATGGIEDR